ncbi:hypothetical protein ACEN8I_22665 [Polaromonas sp. CT11-55]|uniref:hypothetical protein n=1 Tax=Polaromonas sp. CT11-55 TaxID=3243045 RepID=UPI0039A412A9
MALALVLWRVKGKTAKTIAALVVLGIASILPIQGYWAYEKEKEAANAYRERLANAQALFDERCKTAGEKIYKTVDNVEGALLMKIRPDKVNFFDQYAMDDPYGRDVGGRGYIGSFLRAVSGTELNKRVAEGRRVGFSYVEVSDIASKKLYRYTGVIKSVDGRDPNFELEIVEVTNPSAVYGITYEDISTKEDRDHWIAGGLLKILNLQTNSVIAERTGYIFDRGLGSTEGGRGPWEAAEACSGVDRKYGHNARFVFKALKPTEGK